RWIGAARQVIHIDFHTGLGARGTHKLLVYHAQDSPKFARWQEWFGPVVESGRSGPTAYPCRGGIDEWFDARMPDIELWSTCAEFGTAGPIAVLSTLRFENQAYHYS